MIGTFAKMLAGLSLALLQPLYSFCDVETTHGDTLVTKHSDCISFIRVDGMRKMATRQDVARMALAQRVELSGSLEGKGHAILGWFASDPELSAVEIDRLNLDSFRAVARELNMDLTDILDERAPVAEDHALGGSLLCAVYPQVGADQGRAQADEGGAGRDGTGTLPRRR